MRPPQGLKDYFKPIEEESLRTWTGMSVRKRHLWAGLMMVIAAIIASVLVTNLKPTQPAWITWAAVTIACLPMVAGAITIAINPRKASVHVLGMEGPESSRRLLRREIC